MQPSFEEEEGQIVRLQVANEQDQTVDAIKEEPEVSVITPHVQFRSTDLLAVDDEKNPVFSQAEASTLKENRNFSISPIQTKQQNRATFIIRGGLADSPAPSPMRPTVNIENSRLTFL